MRAAIPALRAAGGGSIVNISSESGMVGKGGLLGYSATKWAVRGMTKSAARDLGKYGIRVNSVHPGGVLTAFVMSDEFADVDPADVYGSQPIPRPARRREISPIVVYLASDESSYATASEFLIDGGMISGNDVAVRQ
jgi:3alpha(or 20beta)-hydroxysteroid dehydrogenase